MLELELEVFILTKEQLDLIEMGVAEEMDLSENEVGVITFYDISNIRPLVGGYSSISSDGEDFITPTDYDTLKVLIRHAKTTFFLEN